MVVWFYGAILFLYGAVMLVWTRKGIKAQLYIEEVTDEAYKGSKRNFWNRVFFKSFRDIRLIGVQFYLHAVLLTVLVLFAAATVLCEWWEMMRIPVFVLAIALGAVSLPAICVAGTYEGMAKVKEQKLDEEIGKLTPNDFAVYRRRYKSDDPYQAPRQRTGNRPFSTDNSTTGTRGVSAKGHALIYRRNSLLGGAFGYVLFWATYWLFVWMLYGSL